MKFINSIAKQIWRFLTKKLRLENGAAYWPLVFSFSSFSGLFWPGSFSPVFDYGFQKRCKGVHCVDLGESFPTSIYLQNLASIQPRTIAAVSLAEFVAVHIVLVKLSLAIETSAIPRQMFLFSFIFSYPSGTFSF